MSGDRLIAGLGNPGERYRGTRHNLGFRVVDLLRGGRSAGAESVECGAQVSRAGAVLLAKPAVYMNRSGWPVRCLADRHGIGPEEILVIYDDVALPLGSLRLRAAGGPGGHRGMESIVESLKTDRVPRLRIGIGRPAGEPVEEELAEFVLSAFEPGELEPVAKILERAAEAALCWLDSGLETAMNRFNC